MTASLDEADIVYSYHLVDMAEIDCAALLDRDRPYALVLALLCDFGERGPRLVVNDIFLRLRACNLLPVLNDDQIAESTGLSRDTVAQLRADSL